MATTVYLPATPSVGESIGGALGIYSAREMAKQEQEQRMAELQQQEEAIMKAPDRATALEMFNKIKFPTIEHQQKALQWLNTVKPVTDTTPREVTTYDENGREVKKFVPQNELLNLPPSTKPEEVKKSHFFDVIDEKAGITVDLGLAPTNKPPTKTAKTAEQLAYEEAARDNARQAATRSETQSREGMAQSIATTKLYNTVLGQALDVKKSIGVNGELIFNFEGDDAKADAYRKALTLKDEYLNKFKGDVNKAAVAALKDSGALAKPTTETLPAAAPEPTWLESVASKSRNMMTPSTEAPKATTREAKPSTFTVGKTYVDANGNKAKYKGKDKKGKDIWE